MSANRTAARFIGALILAGYLFYAPGMGMVTSTVSAPGFFSTMSAHQTSVALGAFLMLLNSFAVVGIGILFFPILEKYSKRTALAYLATRIAEGVLLAVGVLALFAIVPVGQQRAAAGDTSMAGAQALGSLLTQFNGMAYQVGEMTLGLGSLFLCSLLFRSRLIPRFLSVWGFVGYAIFMVGTIAEVFGIHIGLLLSAPGGLFEVAVGLWLIIKGFQPEAYGQVPGEAVALAGAND